MKYTINLVWPLFFLSIYSYDIVNRLEINELREELNEFNINQYSEIIAKVKLIEDFLTNDHDLLDAGEIKKMLNDLMMVIKAISFNTRAFINIAEVKGLLSVNDQLVQNITAVNLSATDEIISSSLTILPFTPAGVVHNNASGVLSTSLIVNVDVDPAAAIVDTKLATISTAGKVDNSATTATAANNINTIVLRDGSGNFSAGTITADLLGNATTATTATNFSGSLTGEVTGTQGATVVTNATSINTGSTIVRRTATGGFSAGTISIADAVATGNLVLTTNPSTSTAGNIMKGSSRFIHNYGFNNLFIGVNAGNFTTSGNGRNVGIGANTLTAHTTGVDNIAIGADALLRSTTCIGNIAIGTYALSNTTGTYDLTAIGYNALASNTLGLDNIAIGARALQANTTGSANTAIGTFALVNNLTGSYNTAIGKNALVANITGQTCVAIGAYAMESHTSGVSNVAIGSFALRAATVSAQNIAIGANSLLSNTTGVRNVGIGDSVLSSNITGTNNTAIGYNSANTVTTGSNNIAIGSGASDVLTTGSGNIYINANAGASNEAATTRVGTGQTRCFIAGIRGITTGNANGIAVLIDSAGQLGTISSSQEVKHDIEDMADQSSDVLDLRPVTFVYNGDESNTKQYGLIAEEVEEVFPAIVVHGKDGLPETVQYYVLPVLLLNEMKKQQVTIDQMQNIISDLQAQLKEFVERVKKLENAQ